MRKEKANGKIRGTVAAYLAHKGIDCSAVDPSMTFEELGALSDCCEPLALASDEAKAAAYARLSVLVAAIGPDLPEPANRLEAQAAALLDPGSAAAVRGYARKRGRAYLDWIEHGIRHPRGKAAADLAERWLKAAEARIELSGMRGDEAAETRRRALTMAAACLAAGR